MPAAKTGKRKRDDTVGKYYAVRAGHKPGIYTVWADCQRQTAGFKGASFKKFETRKDAEAFMAGKAVASAAHNLKPQRYYAVAVGHTPGIFTDWGEAQQSVTGVKGPKYRKFDTREEAAAYIRTHGNGAGVEEGEEDDDDDEEDEDEDDDDGGDGEEGTGPSERKKSKTDDGMLCVYTDGSSLANGRANAVAGVGVFFGFGDARNISEGLSGPVQTNQRAELSAMLRALQQVVLDQDMRIISDSAYSISCVTDWYRSWEKNGWKTSKGEPVMNQDLIHAIRAAIVERDNHGTRTLFKWVKGHATDAGNKAADALAVEGARGTRGNMRA